MSIEHLLKDGVIDMEVLTNFISTSYSLNSFEKITKES